MNAKYLELNFEGDWQYYFASLICNNHESGGIYKTALHPTKSAVVGMIGAAFGIPRHDPKLNELMSQLSVKYKTLKEGIIYSDFQVARPPFTKIQRNKRNGRLETNHANARFETIDGKGSDATMLKTVEYLVGYHFTVYIMSEDEKLLQDIMHALDHPVYELYFGKRCCFIQGPLIKNRNLLSEEEMEGIENVFDSI